jgi:hypothetical protein
MVLAKNDKNDSTALIEAYYSYDTGGRMSQARDNLEWNLIAELNANNSNAKVRFECVD